MESSAQFGVTVDGAVLLLLARLTPYERATYLLREAFDYPYERIAAVLHLDAEGCRQIARRARWSIASDRQRPVSMTAHERLRAAFLAAARGGDVGQLEAVLAAAAARPARLHPGGYDRAGRMGVRAAAPAQSADSSAARRRGPTVRPATPLPRS